jgi:hypothetical protein
MIEEILPINVLAHLNQFRFNLEQTFLKLHTFSHYGFNTLRAGRR